MDSEAARHADFSTIRYAQTWEDADILLEALNIQSGDTCVAIASAGDNVLSMLSQNPGRVIALDINPAQLSCLELRVAAYRALEHHELLEFIGSRPSQQRTRLYRRCRSLLSNATRRFWDNREVEIHKGIGGAGKFEKYFFIFRKYVLPIIHSKRALTELFEGDTAVERQAFYETRIDSWRWRVLFRIFFSRALMGSLGRDPSFFRYVDGDVANRLLQRTRHALTTLNPPDNPYLDWILTGQHARALPHALREEHFETIRCNLDKLEIRHSSLESFSGSVEAGTVTRFNLSDIFEYISETNYAMLLEQLVRTSCPGTRFAYWNMLVPRRRPDSLAHKLRPLNELASRLHTQDKTFFYSDFVVEEVI